MLLTALAGTDRLRWLNVELPKVRNVRVDLLGEGPAGELVQIEFQSRNERDLPIRMGEYLFAIGRTYRRLPRQIVLYVGEAGLRTKNGIQGPDSSFRFHLADIRNLDGEALLASPNVGDNIIGLLTGAGSSPAAVRRILKRIANEPVAIRDTALAEFFIVAGLRRRGNEVKREAQKMPILNDLRDHDYFGPVLARERVEGQLELLLGQLKKRFGAVPPRIQKRLAGLSPKQLKAAGLRILDAQKIDDVFSS